MSSLAICYDDTLCLSTLKKLAHGLWNLDDLKAGAVSVCFWAPRLILGKLLEHGEYRMWKLTILEHPLIFLHPSTPLKNSSSNPTSFSKVRVVASSFVGWKIQKDFNLGRLTHPKPGGKKQKYICFVVVVIGTVKGGMCSLRKSDNMCF